MHTDNDTEVIQAIHGSGHPLVIAITGGGASAIGALLAVPGGSASMLQAIVPYSWSALIDWLGGKPDHACSARTARAMAMAAFERARNLAEPGTPVEKLIGVGCTASLASSRPKRGAHRLHLALQTDTFTDAFSLELRKGARDRAQEEELVSRLLIHYVALACGVGRADFAHIAGLAIPELASEGAREKTRRPASPGWRALLLGEQWALELRFQQEAVAELQRSVRSGEAVPGARLLFPGAFNPLHVGHRQMADWARQRYQRPVEFEISITNVDKPPLDYVEIAMRLQAFQQGDTLWLTRAPTFVDKSRIFPGCTFLVGVDTIRRIGEPKYYGGLETARDAAIAELADNGCRFVVFGRKAADTFQELDEVTLPPALRRLCEAVPESEFRQDVSSTELRSQQAD